MLERLPPEVVHLTIFPDRTFYSSLLTSVFMSQKYMGRSSENRTEHSAQQKLSGQDVPCVASVSTWISDLTILISSEKATQKNGSSGCTDVLQTLTPANNTDGGASWTGLGLNGKTVGTAYSTDNAVYLKMQFKMPSGSGKKLQQPIGGKVIKLWHTMQHWKRDLQQL